MGRDLPATVFILLITNFNSHARVGRDDILHSYISSFSHFNSHARVGRDQAYIEVLKENEDISTHTPAWGVTW